MKWILPIALALLSTSSFAYKITDYSGKCFVLDEKKAQVCSIQKGVSSGGGFIYLEFDKKEFLIEQSTSCGASCQPYLGTTPENALLSKKYKKGPWDCYKQVQGSLNVCYMISK